MSLDGKVDELKMLRVRSASDWVQQARELVLSKDYGLAFEAYKNAVYTEPQIKNRIVNEFRTVFLKMNKEFSIFENGVNIFFNFETIMNIYPGNVDLLNDVGSFLYKYDCVAEALCHFTKAFNIDSSSLKVEKNLNDPKSILFPRSNFRTLNDKMRNDAYRAAIRSCINPSDTVLDIDAGVGLLSLYANECNPIAITTCEFTNTKVKLAESVMRENNALQVAIVNKPSVLLNRTDIYGLKSILVTDMIDAGLFGDYILQSICHSWQKLLHKKNKVIPAKAEFFVVGVNCEKLNKKYKLSQHIKNILKVAQQNVHTKYFAETYFSEDVNLYEDLQYICEPQSLFTIDFNSFDEVFEMLNRQKPYNAVFNPIIDGEMNLVIGWFNLHLTEDIMLTTDPRSENRSRSWQQAVFFDTVKRKIRRNEIFSVPFVPYGGRLTALQEPGQRITRVSPETLQFLNDTEYTNMIVQSVSLMSLQLEQTVTVEDVDILDLNPFPLFGVLMMIRGAKSLTCQAKSSEDISFLHHVLMENGIQADKVTILKWDYWSHSVSNNMKFHVIYTNILDYSGEININKIRTLHRLRHSHLASNGICLPSSLTIMGQLVQSNDLEIRNRIIDDNVGYRLSKCVNKYQASQLFNLDIAEFTFAPLSDAFEITSCEYSVSQVVQVPILSDGECNAILCWYKLELVDGSTVTNTNRNNSFVLSTAYMANTVRKVFKDDEVNVLFCVEHLGSFMLSLDAEPY